MMAAGFEESYIRLWSLKGDSLSGIKMIFKYTIPGWYATRSI